MRSSRQGAIPSDLGWLIDELDEISERLRTLEAPSGEALSSTVAKLQALVTNIQAQLDAWNAARWTNAQIVTQISSQIGSTLAGNVTVGGIFYNVPAYNFDITYTRRTAWLGNDGRLGYASSSRDKKTSIRNVDPARLEALLDVEPKSFIYRAEVARRTRLRINDGVDYVPARELGLMAQDVHDAGLHEFVIYSEDGEPEGIEYGMLTVALLGVARVQRDEIAKIHERLDRMEKSA